MKVFRHKNEKYSVYFLSASFIAGTVLHLIPDTLPLVLKLTELYLLLINVLIFSFGVFDNQRNIHAFVFWTVFASLIVFLIEVTGVETGIIFGSFWYGDSMPTKMGGVPLIVALNWTMLILAVYGFFSGLVKNKIIRIFATGIFTVIIDFLVEPVATYFDYWNWENNSVPLQNYLVWFVISVLFSSVFVIMKLHARSIVFKFFIFWQVVFLIIMNFVK